MKAPKVTSLRIIKLSANQVHIKWDPVGSNFYYFVELAESRNDGTKVPLDKLQWQNLGYSSDNDRFISIGINPNTHYLIRVSVRAKGFEQSDWAYTEEFLTFKSNAYSFDHMKEFTLSEQFIKEKFVKNNSNYINFNTDQLLASLMTEDFQFTSKYNDVSQISNKILKEANFHEIQGTPEGITRVCSDINRVMPAEMDGVLYLFERFQNVVKVSNDKGQTWKYYKALDDRVGNPVSKTCIYQSDTTSYVLGYDRVFYGRRSSDVRWSDDQHRFSETDLTFAKIGDTLHLGFDVEVFGTLSFLPGNVSRFTEAIASNNDFLYVAAKNNLRFLDLHNADVDMDGGSISYGKKLFDEKTIKITDNENIVVKKMDVLNGELYILVTGEVNKYFMDPTKPENVIDSKDKGVYKLVDDKLVRVFGNTEEERRKIEHEYTNMSTDGKEIFISYANFKYTEYTKDDKLENGIKYIKTESGLSDKHYHMGSIRTSDGETWKPYYMSYYAEPWFTWMNRTKTRVWINNDNRPVVVYPSKIYTKIIDTVGPTGEDRVVKEVWDKGHGTFYCKNIFFEGFKQYSGGVLIHKSSGEIVGYYEYNYRVRDNAQIIWIPKLICLQATLQNQEHPEIWEPKHNKGEKDPDLRPLLNTMIPDSYLLQNSNFEKFCEYYLQFLSDGKNTHYNKLLNLIRNKYPRETDSVEYLWSEINKRNIYLDKDKRDQVIRFFESRKSDFYSTKGTEASYKFLFKLLYNEDVEIEIESNSGLEYDIVVYSDNINEDIVGRTIYTPTGRCNVTYIEREYAKGKLQWRMTIHNMIGRFLVGQNILGERSDFKGQIIQGIKGKEILSNKEDLANRSRSYYVMKIKSKLPTSRYSSDVLRFVHPVGFGFIGITLLTMFINSGLSLKHSETIINKLITYRYDSGYPSIWPDRVAILKNDIIERDPITGEALYTLHPKAGEDFDIPDDYDKNEGFIGPEKPYTNMEEYLKNVPPSKRRHKYSPLFDQSGLTYSIFRDMTNLLIQSDKYRYKDNINNPRDPEKPSQEKV